MLSFSLALLQQNAAAFMNRNASVPAHPRSLLIQRVDSNKSSSPPAKISRAPIPSYLQPPSLSIFPEPVSSCAKPQASHLICTSTSSPSTFTGYTSTLPVSGAVRLPRRHIERPRMPRTQHLPVLNPSPAQRPLPMRTHIPNRRQLPLHIRQADRHALALMRPRLHLPHLIRPRSLRHPAQPHPLAHKLLLFASPTLTPSTARR